MSAPGSKGTHWLYEGVWAVLTDLFRVPREPPSLPGDSGEPARAYRPCEGWLRYRKTVFWILLLLVDFVLIAAWIAVTSRHPWVGLALLVPWVILIVVPDVIVYIALHLRYDSTWYVLSGRSMRIRRGIFIISETTITFDNIQNVKITQGPLQRCFGFSDLVVETAGGGGGGPHGHSHMGAHVGLLEGVEDAPAMRELIMSRVRASRSPGLGDEHAREERGAGSRRGWTDAHLEALREIAAHAAALRAAAG